MQTQPAPAEPQGRTCPACGANSPATSSYCWQCFKPFPTAPVPAHPGLGNALPPFNQPQPVAVPPAPKRSRSVAARIAVVVVAVLVAAGVAGQFTKSHFSFPEQIAGTPRMHDSNAQSFESMVDQWGKDSENLPLKGAAYGSGSQPDFVVAAAEGEVKNSVDDIEQVVYETITGETFDPSAVTVSGTHDGLEYRCADGGNVSICAWRDSSGSGFVASPNRDPAATRDLLFVVRDAID